MSESKNALRVILDDCLLGIEFVRGVSRSSSPSVAPTRSKVRWNFYFSLSSEPVRSRLRRNETRVIFKDRQNDIDENETKMTAYHD